MLYEIEKKFNSRFCEDIYYLVELGKVVLLLCIANNWAGGAQNFQIEPEGV